MVPNPSVPVYPNKILGNLTGHGREEYQNLKERKPKRNTIHQNVYLNLGEFAHISSGFSLKLWISRS